MKKVLFMINCLHGGGAEKILHTLINNLDSQKYELTIYTMHPENIDDCISYDGKLTYKAVFKNRKSKTVLGKMFFDVLSKIKGTLFNLLPSKVFYHIFIREKVDVEIAFIEGESTKIISGSTNKKSKKYAWIHIDLEQNPWTDFLYNGTKDEREHYLAFDKILCVSDSVRNSFIRKYSFDSELVVTQYNPIDREEIIAKSKEKTVIQSSDKFRMITAGRLVQQKGYDRLIRISDKLKKDGFDFEILILGQGEERPNLDKLIRDFSLEKYVKLLGFNNNPYSIMRKSDLYVCSSRSEGFSTVVSEAIVLGLPVVSTDCAGVQELFGDYFCGLITENNEDALYEALFEILSNPEKLKYYAEESRKRGEKFSLKNTMIEIEELLDA